jgi:protein-S-isoprenylcysteine O-methyltransferase Ste14
MNAQLDRSFVRVAARGFVGLAVIGGVLFALAGRTHWPEAWLFLALFAGYFSLGIWYFFRRDPNLLEERMRAAPNVPRWDRVFVRSYWILLAVLFVTASLDAGRFRWSEMPAAVQAIGAGAIIASFVPIWWCAASNRFLSSNARIQTDRGHRVVQHGPYRFVRHPMYTSLIVLTIGMALMLGSWLALAPAMLIGALFLVRTALEDRMLRNGLEGYREYADRVHERLLPGLW